MKAQRKYIEMLIFLSRNTNSHMHLLRILCNITVYSDSSSICHCKQNYSNMVNMVIYFQNRPPLIQDIAETRRVESTSKVSAFILYADSISISEHKIHT